MTSTAALQRVATMAALVVVQACSVDGSLGYWKADSATREDSAGHASVSTMFVDASSPRAGAGAAGSGGSVMLPNPSSTDACQIARAGTPALEVTVSEVDAKLYDFADGAQFAAGNYRITYVDGCRRFDGTGAWTLHASMLAAVLAPASRGGAYLIMSGSQALGLAPGTVGVIVGPGDEPSGAFATYDECVAANRAVAPVDFPFSGGTLGVMNSGDASPISGTPGEDVGGRSPTFRLSRLDPCP